MVGKKRQGRRAIDGHRMNINERLSFIHTSHVMASDVEPRLRLLFVL
jgi:hypothetical protein